MRIGIVGTVYFNVIIKPDKEFDSLGFGSGYAETCFSSESVELAKKLATEHEVTFITSVNNPAHKRILKHYNINTDYISYEQHGTGFKVLFDGEEQKSIISSPLTPLVMDTFRTQEKKIFDNLDIMILSYFNMDIIKMCRAHKVKIYLQLEKGEDLDLDEHELRVARRIPTISLDNYEEVIK